ncbi:MAG: hypothetical protein H6622_04545 [Halobacteriovoraceae bacterium]|nr:hypothetical protein [Halobacteriovoraceae bacterium]
MKIFVIIFATLSINAYAVNFGPIRDLLQKAKKETNSQLEKKTEDEIQKIKEELEKEQAELDRLKIGYNLHKDSKSAEFQLKIAPEYEAQMKKVRDLETRIYNKAYIVKDKNKLEEINVDQDDIEKYKGLVEAKVSYFDQAYRQYRGFESDLLEDTEKKNISPETVYKYEKKIQDVLDRITKGKLDSNFLLNQTGALKLKLKLDKTTIFALQQNSFNNLNNTLLGDYVNRQIKKSMGNICEIKNSCGTPEKAVGYVQNVLDYILQSSDDVVVDISDTNSNFKIKDPSKNKEQTIDPTGKVLKTK